MQFIPHTQRVSERRNEDEGNRFLSSHEHLKEHSEFKHTCYRILNASLAIYGLCRCVIDLKLLV